MSVSAATIATARSLINSVTSHFTNQAAAAKSASQVLAPAIASYNASQSRSQKAVANATAQQAAAQKANQAAVVAQAANAAAQQAAAQKANQAAAAAQAAKTAAAEAAAQKAAQAAEAKRIADANAKALAEGIAKEKAAQAAAAQKARDEAAKAATLKQIKESVTYSIAQKAAALGEASAEEGEWLGCLVPTSFEWNLPVGKITPKVGAPIYVSAVGEQLSKDQYQAQYGINPETAYQTLKDKVPLAKPQAATYQIATQAVARAEATVKDGDWLGCLEPTSFEWNLPVGKITPKVGAPIYVSAVGEQLSSSQFIQQYGVDPEVAYQALRSQAVSAEPKLVIKEVSAKTQAEQAAIAKGVINLSTISQSSPYETALALVGSITGQMNGAEKSAYVEPIQIGNKIGMNISYDWNALYNNVSNWLVGNQNQIDQAIKSGAGGASSSTAQASTLTTSSTLSLKNATKSDTDDISDMEKLKEKDRLTDAKNALIENAKKVKNALGLTSEFLATDWADIDKMIKNQQVATGVKSLLTYANAVDTLMTSESAYESQTAYDTNNCTGPLCGAVKAVTDTAKAAINISTQPIADALKPLIEAAQKAFDTLKENGQLMKDAILELPKKITDAINGTYDKILTYIKPYTDQIAELQKRLLDLPANILQTIKDRVQPDIDWLKEQATKGWNKIIEIKDTIAAMITERLTPIWNKITDIPGDLWNKVVDYAKGQYENLHNWFMGEITKLKEWIPKELLTQLTALYNWLVTTVGDYLKKSIPTPEEAAKMFVDTQKALQPYVDQVVKDFCTDPMAKGL